MKYILVKWHHDDPGDPVLIYSEIDPERWEHRKVEIFANGHIGFADAVEEVGGSKLGLEPWPDLEVLGSEPEFDVSVIEAQEFEAVWSSRRQA